ncbi:hypothetical protein BH18ACT15_BH18ACT15_10070 [soil metagenome]
MNGRPQELTRDEVTDLLAERPGPIVSFYQPTTRVAVEPEENSLHLKNLLREARERLEARGYRRPEVQKILGPPQALLGNADFWRHQENGLALFSGPDFFRYTKLYHATEPFTFVGESAYVKPLLQGLGDGSSYFILALSLGSIRLLNATRHTVAPVALDDQELPRSLEEALRYDDIERSDTQPRGFAGDRAPGGHVAAHSHGPGDEDRKKDILRFFQAVHSGLSGMLKSEGRPVVLAGVDYLLPIFREAGDLPFIVEAGVEGSPDGLSDHDLRERAWPIVEPVMRREVDTIAERFLAGRNRGLASSSLAEVLGAATAGRVDSLLIDCNVHRWGLFELATESIEELDSDDPKAVDLIDLAARRALLTGAKVYAVSGEHMPEEEPVAALFRY